MDFENLCAEHKLQEADKGYKIENKQKINLSKQAMDILFHDKEVLGDLGASDNNFLSTVVNHIFLCFYQDAEASIEQLVARRKNDMIASLDSISEKEEVCTCLLEPYRQNLKTRVHKRLQRNGQSKDIRINKESIKCLASRECQSESCFYNGRIGKYIKAILEEYTEHPYVERERIYCKKLLDSFSEAVRKKHILKLTLKSRSQKTKLPNLEYVKPYKICQDPEFLYNYLVGLISTSKDGPWEISSIRLSSVKECRELSDSAFLSTKDVKAIEERIDAKGVQFLADNQRGVDIAVKLTPYGEQMYRKILHLRPKYVKSDSEDPSIYRFNCSEKQIKNYFFKFGCDAVILKPASLAEEFQKMYQDAVQVYNLSGKE